MTPETTTTPTATDRPVRLERVRRAALVVLILMVMAGPAAFVAFRAQDGAANFADDERLGRNQLTAARLDIEPGDRTIPIVGGNLAPGDTATGSIEFVNEGTLDLRYSVRSDAVAGADARALAQRMTWRFIWVESGQPCPPSAAAGRAVRGIDLANGFFISGNNRIGADDGDRTLAVGQSEVLCFQASLDIDTPNSLQSVALRQPIVAEAEQLVALPGEEDGS